MSEETRGELSLSTWLLDRPWGDHLGKAFINGSDGLSAYGVKAVIKQHTLWSLRMWKESGVRRWMAHPGSACVRCFCPLYVGRCGEKGSPAWQVSCQCGWWLIALFKLQLCQSWNPWMLIPDLLLEKWNKDEPAPFSWCLQSGLSATARS